jgi:hypothetical protein
MRTSESVPRSEPLARSSRRSGSEGDGAAELFEALDGAALEPLSIQPIEGVGTQVGRGFVVAQPTRSL